MDVKKEIIAGLKKAMAELVLPDENTEIELQEPKEESHGDYSTNIALILFQRGKGKAAKVEPRQGRGERGKFNAPLELAKEIVSRFTLHALPSLEKVEAVAPGFINFYLSKEYLVDQLQVVLDKLEQYGTGENLKDKKIMVEYTDPNPFKEFHIGHLYSNVVGEALSRLLESQGAIVQRVCYQGDVGLHVAKALWGIQKKMQDEKLDLKQLEKISLEERIKFMGHGYAMGAKAYEEDPSTSSGQTAKEEINELNKKIYASTSSAQGEQDPSIAQLYQKGKHWSLEYFETIYSRLGTKFAFYYFESEAGIVGLELVKQHIGDVFEKSDGAIIFPGEKQNLHNRVFINSLGLPTYEAKELGLASTKYKDFPYDQSIIVTGNEINAYFTVLLKALSLIYPDLAAKTKHIGHGMLRLPSGKMSSRTGDVITGEWLLDEAKSRIHKQYKEMDTDTAEMVAIGAVRYALLKSGIGRDISFDFDESISLEGNSGPYLQYTYARTQSVLARGKGKAAKGEPRQGRGERGKSSPLTLNALLLNEEELSLLRTLHRFPEVVFDAAEKFSPNTLCTYLFDLAQKFNLFYQKHQILGGVGDVREFRVALTTGVGHILKTGLDLLGIKTPERM